MQAEVQEALASIYVHLHITQERKKKKIKHTSRALYQQSNKQASASKHASKHFSNNWQQTIGCNIKPSTFLF